MMVSRSAGVNLRWDHPVVGLSRTASTVPSALVGAEQCGLCSFQCSFWQARLQYRMPLHRVQRYVDGKLQLAHGAAAEAVSLVMGAAPAIKPANTCRSSFQKPLYCQTHDGSGPSILNQLERCQGAVLRA